jgi:hypothetical protein
MPIELELEIFDGCFASFEMINGDYILMNLFDRFDDGEEIHQDVSKISVRMASLAFKALDEYFVKENAV